MATLTYDSTPADNPEFNAAEQEALEIGKQAEADQQRMYADKFKDAEALEQAYIELQKKLGTNNEDAEEGVRDETPTEEVEEPSPVSQLINDASQMYAETGELTPEVLEQFNSMSSADIVNAYMEMQANQTQPVSKDLSDADVNTIKNSVGGEKNYQELMAWSGENLDPSDVEAFDSLIENGNPRLIKLAVSGLKAEMEKSVGFDGEMLTGRAARQQVDVFRSQAEVVAAMQDPRYDKDPAFRQDVFNKLDRSNINY